MDIGFHFDEAPEYELVLMLTPNFFRTEMEISKPSGESGWIERVIRVSSISKRAARKRDCSSGGREENGSDGD